MLNTWYLPVSKVHQSKHLTAQRRFCLLFVVEVVSRRAAACICAPGSGLHLLGCRLGGDYDKLRGLCYHHVTIMFILCQICEITELSPTLLSQSQHTSSQEGLHIYHLVWFLIGWFWPLVIRERPIMDCYDWTTLFLIFLIGWFGFRLEFHKKITAPLLISVM